MSTSKRRAVDDVSEQGDALHLSGASALRHADRTRDDGPCPTTSCACPGDTHSSTPSTAPEVEQICKAQRIAGAASDKQDMDVEEVDMGRTIHTVRTRRSELFLRAL
jgi:hypothetical protein